MALINFQLARIQNIAPFGSKDTEYRLHWFGLTDSLNVNDCELFRLTESIVSPPTKGNPKFRIFEDS